MAFRLKRSLPSVPSINGIDFRLVDFNAPHFGGCLFQQYLVDTFIRVERDRLQWIKLNQDKLFAHNYTNVDRLITEFVEKQNSSVEEKIILPSSFPGSTRYFTEHFKDAIAIVRRYGRPDFFITMTCNPDWPEIQKAAKIGNIQQKAQERPDLVARVAKLKCNDLINELNRMQFFGKVFAFVYTIEFQKRGLPHMHLLLIMHLDDKIRNPEQLDDIISAEIPEYTDFY